MQIFNTSKILNAQTLCTSQADDLKFDNGTIRIWVSRVNFQQISAERLSTLGQWELISCVQNEDTVKIMDNEEALD